MLSQPSHAQVLMVEVWGRGTCSYRLNKSMIPRYLHIKYYNQDDLKEDNQVHRKPQMLLSTQPVTLSLPWVHIRKLGTAH